MANEYSRFTVDNDLILKAAGAITATATSTILDVGAGIIDAFVIADVSAIDVVTTDETYAINVEGSNSADMSGAVTIATKTLKDGVATLGRYAVPFRNEEVGVIYRYVRINTVIAGTTPSIDFSAFVAVC